MSADSPVVLLYDANGKPHSVVDGSAVPVSTPHLLVGGKHHTDGNAYQLTMTNDTDVAAQKRAMVEAELKPGTSVTIGAPIPNNIGNIISGFCENGGSKDLVVDGDPTPVVFTYNADATDDIALTEVRLIMSATSIVHDGDSWGKSSALTNGVLLTVTTIDGTTTLANMQINEDVLILPSRSGAMFEPGGANDIMVASYDLGGAVTLRGGTTDKVEVTIRDDFTSGAYGILYFVLAVYGVLQED